MTLVKELSHPDLLINLITFFLLLESQAPFFNPLNFFSLLQSILLTLRDREVSPFLLSRESCKVQPPSPDKP